MCHVLCGRGHIAHILQCIPTVALCAVASSSEDLAKAIAASMQGTGPEGAVVNEGAEKLLEKSDQRGGQEMRDESAMDDDDEALLQKALEFSMKGAKADEGH